jgi:peptidoglycan/xylan/chitin deacetylase (PgdA/CDA1 family)
MAFFRSRGKLDTILIVCCLVAGVFMAGFSRLFLMGEEGIHLPILMYHSVLKDPKRAGKYVVSPDTLEGDLKYLKDNGYTTVVMEDLIRYVDQGVPLPEKPVMLTFDDGHYNYIPYLLPLLEKYDMKAVVSVVGEFADTYTENPDPNPNYGYLSWEEIRQMAQSGRVEIQNHSYSLHHQRGREGAGQKKGESKEDYQKLLREDLERMQKALYNRAGVISTCFTYPLGNMNGASEEVVKELGLRASLGCRERVNRITRDPQCLYGLGRFNRSANVTRETLMKRILE